ncbi:MAG: alpha/beta hydrolase [Bacteroidia bacterium]
MPAQHANGELIRAGEGFYTYTRQLPDRTVETFAIIDLGGETVLYNPHFFPDTLPQLLISLTAEGLSPVRYAVLGDEKAYLPENILPFVRGAEIVADMDTLPELVAGRSHISFDRVLSVAGRLRKIEVVKLKSGPGAARLVIRIPAEGKILGQWPASEIAGQPASLQTADGLLSYTISGNPRGLPIVMISGGPGYSSAYLQPLAARLAANDRIILPDLRGTGRSQPLVYSPETISLAAVCADLDTLRQSLGLGNWVVMGHAFGGMIAMEYAARYPDNVRALILSGSGGADLSFLEAFGDNYDMRLTAADRDSLWYWENDFRRTKNPERVWRNHFRFEQIPYFFDRQMTGRLLNDFPAGSFSEKTSDLLWLDAESAYSPAYNLKNFRKQVLVITGRQDPVGAVTASPLKELFQNCRMVFIERCGHYPWIEQPDEYIYRLSQFLNEIDD